MKKPTTILANQEDSDIAELFDLQSVSVPEDLRAVIFNQAQRQSEKTGILPNHSSTEGASVDGDPKKHSILDNGWTRGFGMAATVLLAVVVVPGLLKQPESSLDSRRSDELTMVEAESRQPTAAVSQAKSSVTTSASSEPSQAAESALANADDAPAVLEQADEALAVADAKNTAENVALVRSRNNGAPDETVGTVQSTAELAMEAKTQSLSSDGLVTFDNQLKLSSLSAYRESAKTWIKQIEALIADGKLQEARAEYRLFEQQHAARAKRFKPDFERYTDDDKQPVQEQVK